MKKLKMKDLRKAKKLSVRGHLVMGEFMSETYLLPALGLDPTNKFDHDVSMQVGAMMSLVVADTVENLPSLNDGVAYPRIVFEKVSEYVFDLYNSYPIEEGITSEGVLECFMNWFERFGVLRQHSGVYYLDSRFVVDYHEHLKELPSYYEANGLHDVSTLYV